MSEQTRTVEAPRCSDSSPARRARVAVTATFVAHALLFASWTAHIPQIKAQLGLTDAMLGTALLGAPVGSVVAMVLSGWLLPRLGSNRMIQITVVGYALCGIGVGLAGSVDGLFLALALWGLFQGSLDVAMNTQGVTVERALGRPIMSRLHGMWSIGGFTGALLGAGAVSVGIGLSRQLWILGAVAVLAVGGLSFSLAPDRRSPSDKADSPSRSTRLLSPTVLVLGGVAFACMLCEGAAADWSANYLHNELGASPGFSGLGYAAFALAMVTMRLSGTLLLTRFTPRALLPALALVSTVGLGTALLTAAPAAALIGFAALGLGLALVVPSAFSAAGAATEGNAGSSIATVAALGWIGYLLGPPLIGHLADAVTLPAALGVLPLLTVVIAVAIRTTRAFTTGSTQHAATQQKS